MSGRGTRPASPAVYCDCGRLAAFRLPVWVLEPDLRSAHRARLDLCEVCYRVEAGVLWRGRLPFARLLLIPELRKKLESLYALESGEREG